MRVLILSDIHGNLPALERVLKDAGSVDIIINAGDLVGYGPWPNECINLSREHGFYSVAGNHDYASIRRISRRRFNPSAEEALNITSWLLHKENHVFLRSLPESLKLDLEDNRVAVYHGSPRDPINEYIYYYAGDKFLRSLLEKANSLLLILGHTHVPFIRRVGLRFVINPGAVGQPRDLNPKASYVILDINEEGIKEVKIKRVKYPIRLVMKKMMREGFPMILAQRLLTGC